MEGRNFRVNKDELKNLNLAPGFEDDLEVYFSNNRTETYYKEIEEDDFVKLINYICNNFMR